MSSTEAITGIAASADSAFSTPAGTVPSGVENPGALLDRDAFLKLLVAQLKYQDPTKPADSSQMLAQSAQLTMVDRLNEIAASFEASSATQRLSLAGTIVGRDISFFGPDGTEVVATVSSARLGPDGLVLAAGDYDVPYDAITAVLAPEPAPTAPPTVAPASPDAADPATGSTDGTTDATTETTTVEPTGDAAGDTPGEPAGSAPGDSGETPGDATPGTGDAAETDTSADRGGTTTTTDGTTTESG